jgi:hypothetical protein
MRRRLGRDPAVPQPLCIEQSWGETQPTSLPLLRHDDVDAASADGNVEVSALAADGVVAEATIE